MATYLLTWNPKRWTWDDLAADADAVAERGQVARRWSCGNTKRIERGDRVFLLRQGSEPRGIIASGTVTTPSYQDEHWDPDRDTPSWFVQVEFDALQDPETDPILPRDRLDAPEFADVYWNTQASGTSILPHVADVLEQEWASVIGSAPEPNRTAEGFIHVHHLRPVSELGERYKIDSVADLRPVCPNCHAVLHRKSPPYTVEEVQEMLSSSTVPHGYG